MRADSGVILERVEGQMTVDECIDVATTGSDGKPPTEQLKRRPGKTLAEMTPSERIGAARRLRDLKAGKVDIPMVCPTCLSKSIRDSREGHEMMLCLACGRTAALKLVHATRKQRIARYLRTGETS